MSEEQTFEAPQNDAPTPASEPAAPFNLREALSQAHNDIEARDAASETPRDDRGRFVAREQDTVSEDGLTNAGQPPAPKADTQPDTEATQEATEPADDSAPQPKGDDNPLGWKAEEKAVFDALDEDTQAMITERFKQVQAMSTRKAQEVGQFGQLGQVMHEQVFGPRLQQMQSQGVNPVQRTAELFAYADAMAQNPAATITRLMQETGVSIHQLAQSAGVNLAAEDSWDAPAVDPLSTVDQRISEALRPLVQRLEAQDAAAQEQHMQGYYSELDTFMGAKDASGQLLHPHFDDVFDDMLASVTTLRTTRPDLAPQATLEAAYKMAVGMNPEIQERIDRANRAKQAQERDKAAKKAKGTVRNVKPTGVSNSDKTPTKGRSIRETMAMVYDEVQN